MSTCPLCNKTYQNTTNVTVTALKHFVTEHTDSDRLQTVFNNTHVRANCVECGTEFTADVTWDEGGIQRASYCDSCLEANPLRGLVVTDISAKEVVENYEATQ